MIDSDVEHTEAEIEAIIKEVDHQGNGKINYTEFLSATVEVHRFLTEERLWMMFKHFDVDDSGYISRANVKKVMTKQNRVLADEEVAAALEEHDITHDG